MTVLSTFRELYILLLLELKIYVDGALLHTNRILSDSIDVSLINLAVYPHSLSHLSFLGALNHVITLG